MKVEGNDKGVFISHEGITIFFNVDYTIAVTKNTDQGWHRVGSMQADAEAFRKLAGMIDAV